MKRRILAFLCVLSIMMGLFVAPVSVAAATTDYTVGYAKKDINPFVQSDYTNLGIDSDGIDETEKANYVTNVAINNPANRSQQVEQPMIKVPMGGYGSNVHTPSAMIDDNADGYILPSQDANGNPIDGDGLFVTATAVTDAANTTVIFVTVDALGAYSSFANDVRNKISTTYGVEYKNIVISASHTHGGPNLNSCKTSGASVIVKYYNYCVDQAVSAAEEALNDRKAATMHKDTVDTSDALGVQMNFVRHYEMTGTLKTAYKNFTSQTWYAGDNFGLGVDVDGAVYSNASSYNISVTSSGVSAKHVSEADDTMNILKFTPEGSVPIALIQWQAHPSLAANGSNLSSDYINALRYRLETSGYRVVFWQGTGGNIDPLGRLSGEPTTSNHTAGWPTKNPDGFTLTETLSSNKYTNTYLSGKYGYLLAQAALSKLNSNMPQYSGEIHSVRTKFEQDIKSVSDLQEDAANKAKTAAKYPYVYKSGTDTYVIYSEYEANSIINIANKSATSVANELSVFILGQNGSKKVGLLATPFELFDRYSSTGSTTQNDWDDLTSQLGGCKPFALSLSNGTNEYLPNAAAYGYASAIPYRSGLFSSSTATGYGSYESNTTTQKEGNGEELVARVAKLFSLVENDTVQAHCPACCENQTDTVTWTMLAADDPRLLSNSTGATFATGHYYLAEDLLPSSNGTNPFKTITTKNGVTLCLNLNGHRFESLGRAFVVDGGGTFNLVDTRFANAGSNATVVGSGTNGNPSGGTMYVNGTFNMYGGTLKFTQNSNYKGTGKGGVITLAGTMSMYGGAVQGAEMVKSTYYSDPNDAANGCGGAIYAESASAKLYMYGGSILSGSVPEDCTGPCVYINNGSAQILLYSDAYIEDICYAGYGGASLYVGANYAGTANLTFTQALANVGQFGTIDSEGDLSNAIITVTDPDDKWKVVADGTALILQAYDESTVAVIGTTEYDTVQGAINACTDSQVVKLIKDEIESETIEVNNNATVDLNGHNIDGISVDNGTLYCMDSRTSDFDVSDGIYGKLTNVTNPNSVQGLTLDVTEKGNRYLKINENGAISFHAVNLDLTHMTLTPMTNEGGVQVCAPGVTYKGAFKGDEKVASKVASYGIAVSIKDYPKKENLANNRDKGKGYDWSTYNNVEGGDYEFKSGSSGNAGKGTLLKNIMKTGNTDYINSRNANMPIYGRAYIKTTEGDFIFGQGYKRTLKEQTQLADDGFGTLTDQQKRIMIEMYDTYKGVMSGWKLPKLQVAIGPSQDGVLKVLVIGNSHGLDATNLLYEVFKDQGYSENKLVLGALYYPGCSMYYHGDYMTNGSAVYDYYENDGTNEDGSWNITNATTADTALNAHEWDVIILQQMNHMAGNDDYMKAEQFKTVINYVKARQSGVPKFGWHMVWTNPDGAAYTTKDNALSHSGTGTNDNEDTWLQNHIDWYPGADGKFSQAVMYQKIVEVASNKIENDEAFLGEDVFDFVIPSATAIQYAQDQLGYTQAQMYRDYTHMSDYGRLMVSYLWYAKIMGLGEISNVGIAAIPEVLHETGSTYPVETAESGYVIDEDMQTAILNAVNHALKNPYSLTDNEAAE